LVKHPELNPAIIETCGMMFILANGFILTGLLWGSAMAHIIDGMLPRAGITLMVTGILSLFGVIHSVDPHSGVYLPWNQSSDLPYHWFAGYTITGATIIAGYYLNRKYQWSPVCPCQ
jgi:AGZA family xanthine/uracil permease-like MFS transporter